MTRKDKMLLVDRAAYKKLSQIVAARKKRDSMMRCTLKGVTSDAIHLLWLKECKK